MNMTHETKTPIAIPIAIPIPVTKNSEQRSFIGLLELLLRILDTDRPQYHSIIISCTVCWRAISS